MRLNNKIVLITGAAKGIGAAIAEQFVKEGAFVYLTDIDDECGQALAQELGEFCNYIHLDVSNEDQWIAISEMIKTLDVLVNNAGITGFLETPGPFDAEHCDLESWNKIHAVNATGTMLGCKYAIKMMKAKGGSIINVSSRSGIVGIPTAVAYASSKASNRNHTKSVALYCAEKKYNIRCNSIHPAAIMTPLWEAMLGEGDLRKKMIAEIESGIPLGHFGEVNDVAKLALYLASDDSSYMTGAELTLDGGILAGSSAAPKK